MKTKTVVLNKEEEVRWISLLSAIDTLDKFCSDNNKEFDDIEIKIPAIKHYMNETLESFRLLQANEDKYESTKTMQSVKNKITHNFLNNIKTQHEELVYS